ncbi:hypothetical protein LZ32DRAFT_431174 [Colletotrichum eremochloae]|nr:hypothetical protein LZ32DRAFT_431174 [Colletotrichum eremochloae]
MTYRRPPISPQGLANQATLDLLFGILFLTLGISTCDVQDFDRMFLHSNLIELLLREAYHSPWGSTCIYRHVEPESDGAYCCNPKSSILKEVRHDLDPTKH